MFSITSGALSYRSYVSIPSFIISICATVDMGHIYHIPSYLTSLFVAVSHFVK